MNMILPAICGGCAFISMALKDDGTVLAWGVGMLGNGAKRKSFVPVQVQGLSQVTAIATRQALREDGTVWRWGENRSGDCGDGTNTPIQLIPVQVKDLEGVKAISACLALREDGTVWAWGSNCYGQLGNGTSEDRNVPVQVHNLNGITAISNGGYIYSLALREDGTVWVWGKNDCCQLGDGTDNYDNRLVPGQVLGLDDVTAISAYHHSLALKKNGTVWAWGSNRCGQLGDGTTVVRNTPVQVQGLSEIIDISAGAGHSLALRSDGSVWAWGVNAYGQLGNGMATERDKITTDYPPNPIPIQVKNLSGVTAISAGTQHSLALTKDGAIWAWGLNRNGELGDGTFVHKPFPVQTIGVEGKDFLILSTE